MFTICQTTRSGISVSAPFVARARSRMQDLRRRIETLEKLPAEIKVHTGAGRILVMDDEEAIRTLVALMMGKMGYEVECASDGAKAVELYLKARESGQGFSAVLLDVTVPGGMGGKEAAAELRRIDPFVKLIVSSGYSDVLVMSEFRKYGFNDVIRKPYTLAQLSEVMRRVSGLTQAQAN